MKSAADLLPRVSAGLENLDRTAPCLVGVSGGVDSVVLFDLLHRAGFHHLLIAHFHHGLRGAEADHDAEFTRRLAAKAGVDFVGGRGQTSRRASSRHESLEEAARALRRAFFLRTAKKFDARTIFLGHHAGDVAETLLFHLGRGSGVRGLSSLRSRAPLDRSDVTLVRPLLPFTRQEIEAYARARRLDFCEDQSNASCDHTRNRLRHDVLPMLAAALGFDPVPALARTAEILAAEDALLEALIAPRAQGAQIPARELLREPPALQRRWLHAWLQARTKGAISFDIVERARRMAAPDSKPAKINLPRGFHLRRRAGMLFVTRPEPKK